MKNKKALGQKNEMNGNFLILKFLIMKIRKIVIHVECQSQDSLFGCSKAITLFAFETLNVKKTVSPKTFFQPTSH